MNNISSVGLTDTVTLPKMPEARNVLNSVCMDLMYYQSPLYRTEIVNGVIKSLNSVYSTFMENNPGFSGFKSIYKIIYKLKINFARSSFNCWPFAWFRHCLRHSDQLEPLPSLRSICHKCNCGKYQGMLIVGTKTSSRAILQQQEENFGIGQYNGANFDSTRGTAQI